MKLTAWLSDTRPLPLVGGILCAVLALHVVLLPLLYFGLDRVIVRTHSELFVAVADGYTQGRVKEIASHRAPFTPEELAAFADELQSSGLVVYCEIRLNGQLVQRTIDPHYVIPIRTERDRFGEGDDQTYHVAAELDSAGQSGALRIGFDEAPITAHIAEARRLIALALVIYIVAVIGAALLLARLLLRPLGLLQQHAIRIADGDRQQGFLVQSGVRELDQLGESLELMRKQLVEAGTQLHRKQRLETVGTLAGGVAHEFNNILVPLTLFTESALKVLPPEHVARLWLERSVAAAQRAREIVSKLLLFSGRGLPSTLAPMNIAPAVEEALRLFGSLRPSNIELDARVDPLVDSVMASSGIIVQIVMNLCTNAYHAIPPSGGRITVALGNVREGGRRVVELVIADTGVGMDAQTLQRVFEPFFTTREVGKGSGLGLAVVHGLVESMRATIGIVSTPGQGTRFRILFPSVGGEA